MAMTTVRRSNEGFILFLFWEEGGEEGLGSGWFVLYDSWHVVTEGAVEGREE